MNVSRNDLWVDVRRHRRMWEGLLFAAVMLLLIALARFAGLMPRQVGLVTAAICLTAYQYSRVAAWAVLAGYLVGAIWLEDVALLVEAGRSPRGIVNAGFFVSLHAITIHLIGHVRHAFQRFRTSERNYRLIADNTRDLILAYGMDRRLLFVNPAVERLLGYPVREMYRRHFINWLHPEDEERMLRLWDEVFRGKGYTDVEFRAVSAGGETKWFAGTWNPLLDENGKQIGVSGVERDIDGRKRAELALRESEAHQRAILQAFPDLIFRLSGGGTYLEQEAGNPESLMVPPEQFLGKNVLEVMPEPLASLIMGHIRLALETGSLQIFEYQLTTLAGEARDFESRIVQSGPYEVLAIARDITERKRVESAVAKARDEAEAAARAKALFLATVSHEVRTPINGVLGLSQLLLDTPLAREQRELVEAIISSGQSLLDIVDDILDFSKAEAGRLDLESADFRLRDTLEEALEALALPASRKGLELTGFVDGEVPELLRGDPLRLRQVLLNLAGNAVKFTDRGEVTVRCAVAQRLPDKTVLRFRVCDTGPGIPADKVASLFEPFTQADMGASRRYEGTGLGLAISRQIVHRMGGEIGLEQEGSPGSTFWFTASFGLCEAPAEEAAPAFPGKKVLIVDDSASSREFLGELVTEWGMTAVPAQDLETALRDLAGDVPDVVLLDGAMPEGGLPARLRSAWGDQVPALVVLTGWHDRSQSSTRDSAGVAATVRKPVRRQALLDALCAALAIMPRALASPKPAPRAPFPGTRGRILIVEDNPVNQRVARRFVERLGFLTDLASNGEEAVAAVGREKYSAILMDCHMPGMDGYEACHRIRAFEGAAGRTPIIAMTAYVFEEDRAKCLAAGMDDYISKPLDFGRLDAILTRWAKDPAR